MAAVVEGVVRRWAEADAAAAAGRPCWWQMREAGMMAVFSCCEQGVVSTRTTPLLRFMMHSSTATRCEDAM